MMRPTLLIVALMVVTVVDYASTMSSVRSVNATLEISVSATVGLQQSFASKRSVNVKRQIANL